MEHADRLLRAADVHAGAGDYAAALDARERAFAALRAAGDTRIAARLAAYQISFDHLALFGNQSVARGWLERGIRLAADSGDCVEAGWVALARALHCSDARERAQQVADASLVAERFGDADLYFDVLAYAGLALVESGRITDGMRQLDEAAAAARGGEVGSETVAGEIYCKLLVACETTLDVRRAEEWTSVFRPLDGRPAVAWASAICRMHYGGILIAAGRWSDADQELTRAVELYDATYRALRGAALVRLAELRVRQGRLGEAGALIAEYGEDTYGVRPWARVAWANAGTEVDRAAVAARVAAVIGDSTSWTLATVPSLVLLAELQLGCGQQERARDTTTRLARLTAADPVDALLGYTRQVQASVSETDQAVAALGAAARHFGSAGLPLEQARARLRLAELIVDTDPGSAAAEARAAADTFAWLGAAAEVDRAWSVLRALGSPARTGAVGPGMLSDREKEVLSLVAQGLSNPDIAQRLFISRKTAAHHVSNLITKLGVRNRTEAAAWATRHNLDHAR
ncbi:LuxR C-terminal-related transcriptional regulator [Kribbella shirazensis]|uniref:DNA-binding CsgD family transcriptional regulator/tetratricopeptide (TPR) repeat protein n=1 Tax=Kribbella shirazensis TaxID=1105143 RepID=A0A7X6A1H5_9ACTN|nr:DNA-binding CsgD family transcriptional regulator/tetratricopeptide (TPR) repeat protein [Kribbella shirazensis]